MGCSVHEVSERCREPVTTGTDRQRRGCVEERGRMCMLALYEAGKTKREKAPRRRLLLVFCSPGQAWPVGRSVAAVRPKEGDT